jgi:hypothetical protein
VHPVSAVTTGRSALAHVVEPRAGLPGRVRRTSTDESAQRDASELGRRWWLAWLESWEAGKGVEVRNGDHALFVRTDIGSHNRHRACPGPPICRSARSSRSTRSMHIRRAHAAGTEPSPSTELTRVSSCGGAPPSLIHVTPPSFRLRSAHEANTPEPPTRPRTFLMHLLRGVAAGRRPSRQEARSCSPKRKVRRFRWRLQAKVVQVGERCHDASCQASAPQVT